MSTPPQSGPQTGPEATAGKKRPRGRPFTGKDDPRNRQNVEAARAADPPPEPAPAVPIEPGVQLYRDMLHVYSRPKGQDRTQGQKDCRRWKDRDLKGFMAKLADLEKAQAGAKPPGPAAGGGPEPCELRIEELLREAAEAIPSSRVGKLLARLRALVQESPGWPGAAQAQAILAEIDEVLAFKGL